MKVSVICVYNNQIAYEKILCVSLNEQNIEIELIGINNIDKKYKSAAEELNYGAEKATSEILIFSHQDIFIKSNNALAYFSETIEQLPSGVIVGTQGVREKSNKYISNITFGNKFIKEISTEFADRFYEVSCVDEGFFGMKKSTWKTHHFDEKLCDNWHLYCVEMCLWNRKNGGSVYVCPIQLHHFSMGIISLGYMKNLKLLCKVYRKDFKYIWTTCYKVKTNVIYINLLYFFWIVNRIVRGKLQ